jgi:hypothetical protein
MRTLVAPGILPRHPRGLKQTAEATAWTQDPSGPKYAVLGVEEATSRSDKMISRAALIVLVFSSLSTPLPADDDDSRRRWWRREWREDYWNRPCEFKIESKPGEFKREVKCKNGIGATWRGEWKEEFWDGPCKVKIEASREEFKEEVKCEGRR